MRLFVLERTPLAHTDGLIPAPAPGDVVAYLRAGQDSDGHASERLIGKGIGVVWGEGLLDRKTSVEIQDFGTRFMEEWYLEDGRDISMANGLSLGHLIALEPIRLNNPRFMVRTGEIIQRLIDAYPQAETVLTDLADGNGIVRIKGNFSPLKAIAEQVIAGRGKTPRIVNPVNPLPPWITFSVYYRPWQLLKQFLGGFRPRWLAARFRLMMKKTKGFKKPVIYFLVGNSTHFAIERLARSGRYHVVAAGLGIPGADSLRHDHLFAPPKLSELRMAYRLYRRLQQLERNLAASTAYSFNGINYGPVFARVTADTLKEQLPLFLIVAAQVRKLKRLLGFSAAIYNGEGDAAHRTLIELARNSDSRLYYIRHSLNTHRFTTALAANSPHTTYLTCGEDHRAEYGGFLPDDRKPRRPVTGNPLTVAMNPLRGKCSKSHYKRLLVLNYGFSSYLNHGHVRACDAYFVEVFKTVKILLREGWTVSYRPHPECPPKLEKRIAKDMGLAGKIHWDDHPDFNSALLDHDAVVTSLSSTHYQALYAGWPTVFFEPRYDDVVSRLLRRPAGGEGHRSSVGQEFRALARTRPRDPGSQQPFVHLPGKIRHRIRTALYRSRSAERRHRDRGFSGDRHDGTEKGGRRTGVPGKGPGHP